MTKTALPKILLTASQLGIISLLAVSTVSANSVVIDPSGQMSIHSSVLGLTTKTANQQAAKEKVQPVDTDAQAVELKATQENKIRVTTQPTDKKAATPLAEEDDVIFTQKVATGEAKIKITSRDQNKYMMTDGYMVKVGTPLSYNLETNEMIVTTPAGAKVVTVLPDQAFKQAELAADTTKDQMELIDYQNSPTYTISGTATKKILGLFPVSFDKKVYVSAISGNVVHHETNGFAKFLDLISF